MSRTVWKKEITLRLTDGFYMFKKVPEDPEKVLITERGALKKNTKLEKMLPANEYTQTESYTPYSLPDPYDQHSPVKKTPSKFRLSVAPVVSTPLTTTTKRYGQFNNLTPRKSWTDSRKWISTKGFQFPSPKLGTKLSPLSEQYALMAIKKRKREARKRRRRWRFSEKKKRKRRKVVTVYPASHLPLFSLTKFDEVRRGFAETEEARCAKTKPKAAFRKLTEILTESQKRAISDMDTTSGVFKFIVHSCCSYLDLFLQKIGDNSLGRAEVSFKRLAETWPRELEIMNALDCIKNRRTKMSLEIQKMILLKQRIIDGSLKAALHEKIYPLPKQLTEWHWSTEAELAQSELPRHHDKLSNIINGVVTPQLSNRWLAVKLEAERKNCDARMSELYKNEIANAGLPTVESVLRSFCVMS